MSWWEFRGFWGILQRSLDVSGFTHHRINHSKLFADKQNHINSIENFWNQAKRVLRKYNGIDRKSFPLFLKECEFRFNFGINNTIRHDFLCNNRH